MLDTMAIDADATRRMGVNGDVEELAVDCDEDQRCECKASFERRRGFTAARTTACMMLLVA